MDFKHDGTIPGSSASTWDPAIAKLARQIAELELTAEELTSAYCKIAYKKTKSFERAALVLQLDRWDHP